MSVSEQMQFLRQQVQNREAKASGNQAGSPGSLPPLWIKESRYFLSDKREDGGSGMEMKQLQYFVVSVDTGSISKAAEMLLSLIHI